MTPLHNRARDRVGGLAVAVLTIAAITVQGCGSGSGSESSRATSAASPAGSTGQHVAANATQSLASSTPVDRRAKADEGGRRSATATSPSTPGESSSKRARPDAQHGVSCPPAYTRSQCIADARSAERQTPSYPVSRPRDCLHGMSRAECKKQIEAELAAGKGGGRSFKPEDCLEDHTRKECEAILEAMGQAPK